jgi:Ca-activated chloride channel family protein
MSVGRTAFFSPQVALFLLSSLLLPAAVAQTALDAAHMNDVHITPRTGAALATASLGAAAPLIRQSVDLVLVPVSVTDAMERLVIGLRQENFSVLDGKQAQQIKHFSREDAPLSVGIIVDLSGSMKNKIDRAREAVTQFCEEANLQDEFFLITFSNQPHLVTDFTRPEEIEQQLLFARAGGQTALLDAIYMGLRKMREAKYGKKALLIISDGGDNHSRYGEGELKAAVKEADVMVYAIGTFDRYFSTEEESLGPELLSNLAEVTGGRAFVLENPNAMPDLARRIGTELRTQYVLGYRPEQVPRDGKWHKISVKLKLPKRLKSLRAHARTGYYAASAEPHDVTASR